MAEHKHRCAFTNLIEFQISNATSSFSNKNFLETSSFLCEKVDDALVGTDGNWKVIVGLWQGCEDIYSLYELDCGVRQLVDYMSTRRKSGVGFSTLTKSQLRDLQKCASVAVVFIKNYILY